MIGTLREWQVQLRKNIVSASCRGNKAMPWVSECWKTGVTLEDLEESGEYASLDMKLASALLNFSSGTETKSRNNGGANAAS